MKFGESLQQERELRGIMLEDISARTKVNIRFLEAIEHDDFSVLPAKAFAKGFLRSYARVVGLDEDVVLTNFEYCHQDPSASEPILNRKAAQKAAAPAKNSIFVVLLLIILLLALIILLYYQGILRLEWL